MPPYGQSVRQKFSIIRNNPIGVTPLTFTDPTNDCCVTIPALAEVSFTSDYCNDFFSPLFFWGEGFSTADLVLQKYVNGAWTQVGILNVNTWGTAYTFGFFTNIYNENAIGYNLQWKLVLNDVNLGEGNYRVKSTGVSLLTATNVVKYTMEFCLSKYTEPRADETTRFEWWTNGSIGNPDDDTLKRDFGTINWINQLRIPNAWFGDERSRFERENVRYQNGSVVWTQDKQIEEYTFKTGLIPNDLHRFIKIDILQGDEIRVTDYNLLNPTRPVNKWVIPISDYEPSWIVGSMLAPVEVKFAQRFQNLIHKRN